MAVTPQRKPSRSRAAREAAAAKSSPSRSSPRGLPRFLDVAGRHASEASSGAQAELDAEPDAELEAEPEHEVAPPVSSAAAHDFGGEDDGDDAGDDDGAGVDDATGDAADPGASGSSPAGDAGDVQQKCDACSSAAPERLVQQQCSACAAERPVQQKCSACDDEPRVQQKCSSCAAEPPVQQACSTCAAEPPVQQRSDGGALVQMGWDCTEHTQPTCRRDPTPISTLVQTRSSSCEGDAGEHAQPSAAHDDALSGPARIHREARRGLQGASSPLPHRARIQAAFGRHDVSFVRVQTGGAARSAAKNMGALAFASGERIAFRETPDLHLAAHEAAHTIQQRAGITLQGGVGTAGDRWERHADRVADAVVAGRSAEPILDEVSGRASLPGAHGDAANTGAADPRDADDLAADAPGPDAQGHTSEAHAGAEASTAHEASAAVASDSTSTVQQQLVSGATRQIEPELVPVPPPTATRSGAAAAAAAAASGAAGAAGGAGEGAAAADGEATAATDPAAAHDMAEGPGANQPDPTAAETAPPPPTVDTGSVGASDCYGGEIREPTPDEEPEDQPPAPPPLDVQKETGVAFKAWEQPDDTRDCAAAEAAQRAAGGAGGAGAGGAGAAAAPGAAAGAAGGGAAAAAPSQCEGDGGGGGEGEGAATGGGPTDAPLGGGGGARRGASDDGDPELLAKIAERESQRDAAVDKYLDASIAVGRMSMRARRLPQGLRWKGQQRGSAGAESANDGKLVTLRTFAKRASKQMFDALELAQQDVPTRIADIANETKQSIQSAIETEKGKITDRIDAAREAARGQAGGARAHVIATHVASVAQATAQTMVAIGKILGEHAITTTALTTGRDQALTRLNALVAAYRTLHNLSGEGKANAAVAEGNARATTYETCKKGYASDGFFVGCLTVRRALAQQKAACSTAEGASQNMLLTAARKGNDLRPLRTQYRCALISSAGQAQQAADQLSTQLTQGLSSSLTSTITALDTQRDANLDAIDAALAAQLQSLAEQEHSQRQSVNDTGYMQEVAVEELAHTSAEGLVSGIDQALRTTERTVRGFLEKMTSGDAPDEAKLQAAIESADEGLESGLGELMERMRDGLVDAERGIAEAGANAWLALGAITSDNDKAAAKAEQSFAVQMASTRAAVTASMGKTTAGQLCKAREGETLATTKMKALVAGFGESVTKVFTAANEKLVKSLTELNTDLQQQFVTMGQQITRNAWLAADKEQPAWVQVLAVVLIILVIVASIVVSVLTAGAGGIIGAILIGALVGAISAGLIQVLNNWRTGERLTRGVGRAMLIGAVGGALGGGLGGGANALAGVAIREGMRLGTRVAINVAINLTADMLAEAGTQAFAHYAFGQEFQLSGFITAAVTSGISLSRSRVPTGRPRARAPDVPNVPSAPRAPRESVGTTLRSLRPRGSDLVIGAAGAVVAESFEKGEFDLTRAISTGAGMVGASSAARHGHAAEIRAEARASAARSRPAADVGGAPSGARPGDAPAGGTRPPSEAPEATTRPTEVDAAAPRRTEAEAPRPARSSTDAPEPRPRTTDEAHGPTRPAEGGAPRTEAAGGAGGAPAREADAPRAGDAAPASSARRPDAPEAAPAPTPRDAADAPLRPNDAEADLVAPGASRPIEVGGGSHTVAAKRTPSGDVVITLCSACARMSGRLGDLAAALPEGSPARTRLDDLRGQVTALENRIRAGDVTDIPGEVSALAGRIRDAASEFPSGVGRNLADPSFDPARVHAAEEARLANPAEFSKVQPHLGAEVPPLPDGLRNDYTIDVNGRISRRPPKETRIPLSNVDGRVEVRVAPDRTPTLDADYVRSGLSPAEAADVERIRNTPRGERTPADIARLAELHGRSQPIELNDGRATLRGDARPLTDVEGAELRRLRESDAPTADDRARIGELEARARRAEAADALARRNDASQSQGDRNKATERLGELAGDEVVARNYPDASMEYRGQGAGTVDAVYRNGSPPPAFIIGEAKGGSATNSSSRSVDGERLQQGRRDYLTDVLNDPRTRATMDPALRRDLLRAIAKGDVAYIEVSQPVTAGGGLGDIRAREYDIGRSTREAPGGARPRAEAGGAPPPPRPPEGSAAPVPAGAPTRPGDVPPPPPGAAPGSTRAPSPDAAAPTRPASGGDAAEPRARTGADADAAEPHATRPAEADADPDLVAPGASHPVLDGHTVSAKRTGNGRAEITMCSACTRMRSTLEALAGDESFAPTTRERMRELAGDVAAVEARINRGEIPDAEIPDVVAALAQRIQATAEAHPSTIRAALTEPDFDPAVVRARERARIDNPEAFARVEGSLGAKATPLPAALAPDYRVENGHIVANAPDRLPLAIVDDRIELAPSVRTAEPDVPSAPRVTGGESADPRRRSAGGDTSSGARPPADDAGSFGDRLPESLLERVDDFRGIVAQGTARPSLTAAEHREIVQRKYGRGSLDEIPVGLDVTQAQVRERFDALVRDMVQPLEGRPVPRDRDASFVAGSTGVSLHRGPQGVEVRRAGSDVPLPVGPDTRVLRVEIDGRQYTVKRIVAHETDRIILFRVDDKPNISGLARDVFTVPGPVWTPASSVGFVAGAVRSGKRIVLATRVNAAGLGDVSPAIYAREIQFALEHGYGIRMARPDEVLTYPTQRSQGNPAAIILEPPTVRPALLNNERVRSLFDAKAGWPELPRDLAQMLRAFSRPPRRDPRRVGPSSDAPRPTGTDTAVPRDRDVATPRDPAAVDTPTPRRPNDDAPSTTPRDPPTRSPDASTPERRPTGETTEGATDPSTTRAAPDENPVAPVKVGDEEHGVTHRETEDGDTKIDLCSKCRELAMQLRTVADSLGEGSRARAEAERLAQHAERLQQRGDLSADHPDHLGREALTAECNKLAREVEVAAREHAAELGRLAQPDPVGARPRDGEDYVNPHPIDGQGRLQGGSIPPEQYLLVDPKLPLPVQAFKMTAAFQGRVASRVQYFERLAGELNDRIGWRATRVGQTEDGAHVWFGDANGKVLIITADGAVYSGDYGRAVTLGVGPKGPVPIFHPEQAKRW